jgi:cbb3-type cytochrome oxidase subunit 3
MNPPDSEYGRKPFVLDDTTTVMMDDQVLSLIKPELVPGEKLLWAGKPVRAEDTSGFRGWLITFASIGAIPLFCGLVMLTFRPTNDALARGIVAAGFISLVVMGGLLIAVVGSLFERLGRNRSASSRTFALTDHKAILWQPETKTKAIRVITIPAHSIGSVNRKEYPNGSGDVIFSGNVASYEFSGFFGVDDVRHVEALARATLVNPDYRHNDPELGEF